MFPYAVLRRSKNVVDKRRLLELDEQRRRAEADKMAAIRALEARLGTASYHSHVLLFII